MEEQRVSVRHRLDFPNEESLEQIGRLHRAKEREPGWRFAIGVPAAKDAQEGDTSTGDVPLESFLENFDAQSGRLEAAFHRLSTIEHRDHRVVPASPGSPGVARGGQFESAPHGRPSQAYNPVARLVLEDVLPKSRHQSERAVRDNEAHPEPGYQNWYQPLRNRSGNKVAPVNRLRSRSVDLSIIFFLRFLAPRCNEL